MNKIIWFVASVIAVVGVVVSVLVDIIKGVH
jgi:hypothetical protein